MPQHAGRISSQGGSARFSGSNSCWEEGVSPSSHGERWHPPFPPSTSQLRDNGFRAPGKYQNNSAASEDAFLPDMTPELHRTTPTPPQHFAATDHQGCPRGTTTVTTAVSVGWQSWVEMTKTHTQVEENESLTSHSLKTNVWERQRQHYPKESLSQSASPPGELSSSAATVQLPLNVLWCWCAWAPSGQHTPAAQLLLVTLIFSNSNTNTSNVFPAVLECVPEMTPVSQIAPVKVKIVIFFSSGKHCILLWK